MNKQEAKEENSNCQFIVNPRESINDTIGNISSANTLQDAVQKCRERNKIHARKTRERKKMQYMSILTRIDSLNEEGIHLRQIVDDIYTASAILSLNKIDSRTCELVDEVSAGLVPSSNVCGNIYANFYAEFNEEGSSDICPEKVKRIKTSDSIEREDKRRERNRIHARKTRNKKKHFIENSEEMIISLENEIHQLKSYLLSINCSGIQRKSETKAYSFGVKGRMENIMCDSDRKQQVVENDLWGPQYNKRKNPYEETFNFPGRLLTKYPFDRDFFSGEIASNLSTSSICSEDEDLLIDYRRYISKDPSQNSMSLHSPIDPMLCTYDRPIDYPSR